MKTTEAHHSELESFLFICEPSSLRKTILYLYFTHTMEKNNLNILPDDFDTMSCDIFHLLEFLDRMEELSKQELTNKTLG